VILTADQIEQVPATQLGWVDHFYKSCGEKVRCGRRDRVYILRQSAPILAAARLLPVPERWLLRNLTVAPSHRRRGLARQLMQALLQQHSNLPLCCYALAELEGFYRSLGFTRSLVEQHPAEITQPFMRYRESGRTFVLMAYWPEAKTYV